MKKYIAVLELEDEDEIFDAKVSYMYHSFDLNYTVTESVELKEESENARNKTYEDGLNEAWELARKIGGIDNGDYTTGELSDIFGTCSAGYIFDNFTVSETMDAIENSKRIKVGDEVEYYSGLGVVIESDDDFISVMKNNGKTKIVYNKTVLKKTGRHFPQIEEVLKQMEEGEDE